MKALYAALAIALLSGSAYAQGINLMRDGDKRRTQQDYEKEQAIDQAYKAQMQKIPDQKASSDPWGSVRSTESAKPAPAARKPKQP